MAQSSQPKKPTFKNTNTAPVVEEPKRVTSISFSLAPEAPKKSPTFDDTSGSENKKPTEINTRARTMVDRGQVAKIQVK